MLFGKTKLFLLIILFVFSALLKANADNIIDKKGLEGAKLVSLAVDSANGSTLFVGTDRGLFKRDKSQQTWQIMCGAVCGIGTINQIYLASENKEIYLATDKGLFLVSPYGKECKNIFNKSDESERVCLCVSALKDGSVFVGTNGGLYFLRNHSKDWIKVASPFDKEKIVSLYGSGLIIYAATFSNIYKSEDSGKNWNKIFNSYFYQEDSQDNNVNSEVSEEQESQQPLKYILGVPENPKVLYVASSKGVFATEDAGDHWNRLPQDGLNIGQLRSLFMSYPERKLFAITKTGVYELINTNNSWKSCLMAYDCRQLSQSGSNYILITTTDIFEYSILKKSEKDNPSSTSEGILSSFSNEPSIEEVQRMAVDYAEVSDKKIKDWRRRAAAKALLPELSVDFDRTVATSLGASYQRCMVGPLDWGMSLKWNFADLIYNSDQTSIDSRSKLMVELRNDILSEVTRLYFERRKLQIELASNKENTPECILDKKLRILELTALIDRLTGCNFSKILRSRTPINAHS